MNGKTFELELVSYYKAPYHTKIKPYTITEGYEYIELIVDGEVFFDDGTGIKSRTCGSLFWHIPGDSTIHDSNPDFPYQCLCVRFRKKSSGIRQVPRCSFWNDEVEVRKFSDTVLRAFHAGNTDIDLLGNYIYSRLRWEIASARNSLEETGNSLVLARAMDYINKRFMDKIDISDVASYSGVSMPHLFLLFREKLKDSPHNYLNQIRIREARQRLVKTDDSIKEIASLCGFDNIESFYRVFRKYSRMTPGNYRKKFTSINYLKG